jgi:hypothetical protein
MILSFLSVSNYMFKTLVTGMGVKACVEHLSHVFFVKFFQPNWDVVV